jgi:hypothetical protein
VGHLVNIGVAVNARHVAMDRFIMQLCVNIIIMQDPLFIIPPEPPVLVTEQAVFRVTGK